MRTKVWVEIEGRFVIGDGGLRLLEGIREQGSLLRASRAMGWSYRHAWGYLRQAEAVLGAALTTPRPGKGASRGMVLTATGQALLDRLAEMRQRIDKAVGPGGPTAAEIAERGRARAAPAASGPLGHPKHVPAAARPGRIRDGDWRSLR